VEVCGDFGILIRAWESNIALIIIIITIIIIIIHLRGLAHEGWMASPDNRA
jgi:hypothetical protein